MAVTDTDPIPVPVEPPPHECPHCGEIAELREHQAATDVAVAALASQEATEADEEAAFFEALAEGMMEDASSD